MAKRKFLTETFLSIKLHRFVNKFNRNCRKCQMKLPNLSLFTSTVRKRHIWGIYPRAIAAPGKGYVIHYGTRSLFLPGPPGTIFAHFWCKNLNNSHIPPTNIQYIVYLTLQSNSAPVLTPLPIFSQLNLTFCYFSI